MEQHTHERISYLDSVRGLAALWVMLYHFINHRFHEHSIAKFLSFFINGETAFFLFVLSGFVLSYKYIVLKQPLDFRKFYINRFLRLWPAFFVAVVIHALYHYRQDLSFDNLVAQFVWNKGHFWEEALLIRTAPGHDVNPVYLLPGWAVVIQLSLSFFIPFMIALAWRKPNYLVWMLLAFLLIGSNLGAKYVYHIHYVLGVLCCCYYFIIKAPSFKNTRWYKYRWLFISVAILFFSMRQLGRIHRVVIFGPEYKYWVEGYLGISYSYYSVFASFVFLVAVIHSGRLKRWLDNGVLRFIGKISYSLYLMHWVVVLAIYDNWGFISGFFPSVIITVLVTMVACTAISVLLATCLYYWVELPSIRFSKRLVSRFKPSFVISIADH